MCGAGIRWIGLFGRGAGAWCGRGNRCEWCGARNHEPHPATGSHVVLTTAHVYDRTPGAAGLLNLAALCQRCHLNHDRAQRLHSRRTQPRPGHGAAQPLRRPRVGPARRVREDAAVTLDEIEKIHIEDKWPRAALRSPPVRRWPAQCGRPVSPSGDPDAAAWDATHRVR